MAAPSAPALRPWRPPTQPSFSWRLRLSPASTCPPRAAGCARPGARSGGSRTRHGRPRRGLGALGLRSSGHIPAFSSDGCAGAAELRAVPCVVAGEVGEAAGPAGRRNRCMTTDSRSKWRKTGGIERASGYHASNQLTIPMLGRTPARKHVIHRIVFSPQHRVRGIEPTAADSGIRGEHPIDRDRATQSTTLG